MLIDFISAIAIGTAIACLYCRFRRTHPDTLLNIYIGISGALIGRKVAEIFDTAIIYSYRDGVAAALGSVFLLIFWQKVQRSSDRK